MRFSLRLLSFLLASPLFAATDFLTAVPGNAAMVIQVTDTVSLGERWQRSPLPAAFEQFDFQTTVESFLQIAASEESVEGMPSEEDVETLFGLFSDTRKHFAGSACFYVGDLRSAFDLQARNKERRASLLEEQLEASSGAETQEDQELTAETEAMDHAEMKAFFGGFRFLADLRDDGQGLLQSLEEWTEAVISGQTTDSGRTRLEKLTINDTTVYRVDVVEEDDEGEERPSSSPAVCWAVQDSVLVATFGEEAMRDQLNMLDRGAEDSLRASKSFQDAHEHTGAGDLLFLFNIAPLHDWLLPLSDDQTGQLGMPSGRALLDWFALQSFEPYVVSMSLQEEGLHTRANFGFSKPSVFSDFLMQQHEGNAPEPAFIHRDFISVASGQFSIAQFYESLEKHLTTLSPQAAAGLGMARMMAAGQLGLDFKTQLLDLFGTGFVFVQDIDFEKLNAFMKAATEGEPERVANSENPFEQGQYYLVAISVKDEATLTSSLNTILAKFHPEEAPPPSDYKGYEIHNPLSGLKPAEEDALRDLFSYTMIDGFLVISLGNPKLLHRAIDAREDRALRLWDTDRFKDIRTTLPAACDWMEYTNQEEVATMFESMFTPLKVLTQDKGLVLPDFSAFTDLFSSSLGVSTIEGLSLRSEAVTLFAKDDD